ncbi:MAG: hypothetical protein JNM27_14525 [Leptospirales bacterium]|nr:hypothetical protein [Leptospirales bacterium]
MWNRNQVRSKSANALVLILSTFAGFLIAEVILRVTGYEGDYQRAQFKFATPFSTVRRDSWVLQEHSPDPGMITVGKTKIALSTSAKEKRVLFLGDSVTEGYGVEPSRTFVSKLNSGMLAKDTLAINAGVYGFNTYDEYELYAGRLAQLQANTVVLGLFPANDTSFNLLKSDRLRSYPAWIESTWLHAQDHSAFIHFGFLSAQALNHRLRLFTGNSAGLYFSRIALIEKETGLHLLHYREGEIAGYLPRESDLMRHAYELLERVLRRFEAETSRRSSRFIVLILPSPAVAAGAYYSPIEPNILQTLKARGIQIQPTELDVDRPRRRITEICGRLGLLCLDATPTLRQVGATAFLPGDDHLSDAGHSAVARFLATNPGIFELH